MTDQPEAAPEAALQSAVIERRYTTLLSDVWELWTTPAGPPCQQE